MTQEQQTKLDNFYKKSAKDIEQMTEE